MNKGFSLPELMVSIALLAVIFASIGSFTMFVFQRSSTMVVRTSVDTDAVRIGKALSSSAMGATYIERPPPGGGATADLSLWTNVNPGNGTSPIVAGVPREYSYFCVDKNGRMLRYRGKYPRPGITCGNNVSKAKMNVIAGGISGKSTVAAFFRRPANEDNVILINYRINFKGGPAHKDEKIEDVIRFQISQAASL